MMYCNINTPFKLSFRIKIRGRTTSYVKRFRRYENFPKNVKISSIIHENDVITSNNLKSMLMSHEIHLIRDTYMVKYSKNFFAENLRDRCSYPPHYYGKRYKKNWIEKSTFTLLIYNLKRFWRVTTTLCMLSSYHLLFTRLPKVPQSCNFYCY